MTETTDVWKTLTKTALRRLSEVDDHAAVDVAALVERTLAEHRDVPHVDRYRESLTDFVRDVTDWTPPPRAA